MRNDETYEWDTLLDAHLRPFIEVRLNKQWLEIKLNRCDNVVVQLDNVIIPKLIKMLERTQRKL